jgi:type VI secretion system protein ImpC
MEGGPDHDLYLWGNPSFACLYLLAQAFSEYGWDFQPGIVQDIEDLPLYVYKEKGESKTKPCAEVVLTQGAVEAILEKGFMPLISSKNQDRVQLARFQATLTRPVFCRDDGVDWTHRICDGQADRPEDRRQT